MPVDKKKNNETKVEEENTKIANSEETALVTPIFLDFEWLAGQISQIVEKFERFHRSKLKKSKAKPYYHWRAPPFVEP